LVFARCAHTLRRIPRLLDSYQEARVSESVQKATRQHIDEGRAQRRRQLRR
jgi:hypothetical protein